jgi:L-seryl-tRNA(Ser) seleniumtransferase
VSDARRALPSVERLLNDPGIRGLMASAPRNLVVAAVRESIASVRGGRSAAVPDWLADITERVARRTSPSLHPVQNATGVVLHTNLGRSPLARRALDALLAVAAGYSTLELDSATGTRGSRTDHCASLLAGLTGAEDALVVNNAAAALVLALNAVAAGREVLISRGELIEIGGSFRIPDILAKSGAVLREVGTTNRTHLDDYRAALSARAGAVLTVHRSNFEQTGFVATPDPGELAVLARSAGVPYLYDVGGGLLVDLSPWKLSGEPRVQEAVATGADLVVFSGDKLLGGPQAGCLVGRRGAITEARRNPFARAMRADKLTLAALEATLSLYHDPAEAIREIPVLRMLTLDSETLAQRAATLHRAIGAPDRTSLLPGVSAVGGGSFPAAALPTTLVAVDPGDLGAAGLALRLRLGSPPTLARVQDQRVVLDPRTLPEESLGEIGRAVAAALVDA